MTVRAAIRMRIKEAGLKDAVLNTLVGAAIVSVVNAGSSSEIVGAFAADYPDKVKRVFHELAKKETSMAARKDRKAGRDIEPANPSSYEKASASLKRWHDASDFSRETQEAILTIGIVNSQLFFDLLNLTGPGYALSQTRKAVARFPSDVTEPLKCVEAELQCVLDILHVIGVQDRFKY